MANEHSFLTQGFERYIIKRNYYVLIGGMAYETKYSSENLLSDLSGCKQRVPFFKPLN